MQFRVDEVKHLRVGKSNIRFSTSQPYPSLATQPPCSILQTAQTLETSTPEKLVMNFSDISYQYSVFRNLN